MTKDQAQLFLKYVEDVTEDNYYIFCTTAPDKFLPTLRDRCAINIEFKQVPARDLMNLLINICYLEQLKPNEDVLRRIIEHSEGKPRVAVRELQQRYYAGDLEKITVAGNHPSPLNQRKEHYGMKKVVELIEYLKARNVELGLSGENIRFRGSRTALTPEIMDEMKSHKAEIISYLNLETAPDGTPLRNSILLGDSQQWLKSVPDNSIDLMVTDPPYGMKFMGKAWDKALPKVEIWKECLRVLKPGAFAFVMCIPRQDLLGRMIADLEAAGFDTGFTSIYWTFASGFPKAQNISKAIDRKAGAAGKIIGRNPNSRENCDKSNTVYESGTVGKTAYITQPATEMAQILEGAYAGFQPKPAVEVIIVAMKPVHRSALIPNRLNRMARESPGWMIAGYRTLIPVIS